MPKIVEKKAWYQMSDEEKAEYDAKVQAEVDASGCLLYTSPSPRD